MTDDVYEMQMLDEVDLYEVLGRELLGDGRGASPSVRGRHRDFGRAWFEKWLSSNRLALCTDPRVVALTSESAPANDAEILAVLIDFVAGLAGSVPVTSVSLLVLRRGLLKVCSN